MMRYIFVWIVLCHYGILFFPICAQMNGDMLLTIEPAKTYPYKLQARLMSSILDYGKIQCLKNTGECDLGSANKTPVLLLNDRCYYSLNNSNSCQSSFNLTGVKTGCNSPSLDMIRSSNGGEINVTAKCRNGTNITIASNTNSATYLYSTVQLRWSTVRLNDNPLYQFSLHADGAIVVNETTWEERWGRELGCHSSALPSPPSGVCTPAPNTTQDVVSSTKQLTNHTITISGYSTTINCRNCSTSAPVSAPENNTTQEIVPTTKQLTGTTVTTSAYSTTTDCWNCSSSTLENTTEYVVTNSTEESTKPNDGNMLTTYIISGSVAGVLLLLIIIAAIYARKRYRLRNEKICGSVITSPENLHRPMLGEQPDPTYSHLGDRVPNKRYQLTYYESHDIPIYGCHQNNNVYHELERPTFCGQDNSNSESDRQSSIYSTISDSNLAQSADRPATQEKINTDNDTAVNRIFGAGSEKVEEKPQLHVEEETKRRVVRDLYSQVRKPHPKNNATENIEIEMIENDIYEPTKKEDDEC